MDTQEVIIPTQEVIRINGALKRQFEWNGLVGMDLILLSYWRDRGVLWEHGFRFYWVDEKLGVLNGYDAT